MLQEKGKLNINDKISKYLPDYPDGDKISIYNLLTHTSGIMDYVAFSRLNKASDYLWSPDEIIALFKNYPPNFEPGSEYSYSNSGYVLLGYIIEKVSGIKYEDFVYQNILKPFNMTNSGFDYNKEVKNLAVGYEYIASALNKAPDENMSACYSAGGMHSTVEDLYKWDQALYTEKLINKESLKQMYTPNLSNYGLGVLVVTDNKGETIIEHNGGVYGFLSFLLRNIDAKYTIIFLTNRDDPKNGENMSSLSHELVKILDSTK